MSLTRWAQRTFTRDNFVAAVKTLAWLGPLTALIWVYAEREQIVTSDPETIPIELRSGHPNRYVALRMSDKNVIAEFRGPRGRLDEVLRKVRPGSSGPSVVITIDQNLPAGQAHELDAAEQLANSPILARSGVTVVNCKPARLPIFVDEYITKEVEVHVPPGVTNLVSPPVFEPKRVTVRAPSKITRDAELRGPLRVYADFPSGVLEKPGPYDLQVGLFSPDLKDESITFNPTTVRVKLEVGQSNETYTIPSMAIFVSAPQGLLERYRVKSRQQSITSVTVVGPPDKIRDLREERDPKPKAVLTVTSDDIPRAGRPQTARLTFELPEGVRVSDEDARRTEEFTLIELPNE
jgi:hypothetical protein